MTYVIERTDHGRREFVTQAIGPRGSSFTPDITQARTFATREQAQREACENESVRSVDDLLRRPGQ